MKKITLLLAMVFIAGNLFSQTLNQTTTWPDATWTITGTYSAANLLQNPTTSDTKFQFDDAQVSNSGDAINLESPVIDLSAAFTANEKVLKITVDMAFTLTPFTTESLGIQYWDADASTWTLMPEGSPSSGDSAGDYNACATGPQDIYFDFKDLTVNQQQNFKYKFFYNDGGLATGKGVCMAAPTVISVDISCSAPTALHTTLVGSDSVTIGWTANSSETQWQLEYGITGFALGFGVQQHADVNPQGIPDGSHSINSDTSYDFYVRANCIPDMTGGAVYSPWSTKLNFTTINSCVSPSGGTADNQGLDWANLTWAPQGSESLWLIEYGPVGYVQGSPSAINSISSNNSNTNTVSGLSVNTSYDFYVRANCGGGTNSNWAGPYTFTTAAYSIGWLNVQWPASGSINAGGTFDVFAQIYVAGLTKGTGQGPNITAWIGFSTTDTNPNTWSNINWFTASYNTDSGNNDEYMLDLGAKLTTAGTYYYASRFQLFSEAYQYGGFNGGSWDGSSNVSGQLTVTGTLGIDDNKIEGFNFYPNPIKDRLVLSARQSINQVEVYNLLGQVLMVTQPNLNNYEMQLSSLKAGIYFLKVTVADKIGTYKIVKQ